MGYVEDLSAALHPLIFGIDFTPLPLSLSRKGRGRLTLFVAHTSLRSWGEGDKRVINNFNHGRLISTETFFGMLPVNAVILHVFDGAQTQ
jgi:hypothetical protein